MTLYFRRRLLFRVLALLMMFLILALASVVPIMQASALAPVIAYGAKELVAALLIAGGASFATTDTARDAAAKVWDWLGQQASGVADKLQQIVALQIDVANTVGDGAVRISQSIWYSVSSAYDALFPSDVGGIEYGKQYVFADYLSLREFIERFFPRGPGSAFDHKIRSIKYVSASGVVNEYSIVRQFSNNIYYEYLYENGVQKRQLLATAESDILCYFYLDPLSNFAEGSINFKGAYVPDYNYLTCSFSAGTYSFSGDGITVSGGLTYPGEDTMIYVPDIPEVQTDEEGKDVVIWPDLSLNPDDFVLDIPKTATGDLVDVPYDTLVDASTGTAVGEGEGTGTGEGEGTGSGILDILGDIWDAIRNFFDSPSDFKLDFDGFKNLILVDRFPFCIPFDLRDAIMLFAASAADYKFSIDLDTAYFSVHHTVDLSPYTVPITFFRYVVVVWFVYVLILRTRDVMKW